MKKLFLIVFSLFTLITTGVAQKGMQGVGFNVGGNFGEDFVLGGGLKYQYNISNYIRLEPSFNFYVLHGQYDSAFDLLGFLNFDVFFFAPRAFRPYFYAGPGFVSFSKHERFFGANAGFGLDYRLSHKLSLQVEVGAVKGFDTDADFDDKLAGKVNIGLSYNF